MTGVTRPGGSSREARALLPWVGAALVWFALVAPMRADQGGRLAEQSRARRERLKSERVSREIGELRARMAASLGSSCRASTDPAALRQAAIAATSGLALSPFALTVTGGASGGAQVEAAGSPRAALELRNRLGDPALGGFLRSAAVRDRGGRYVVSASTGVLSVLPANLPPAGPCASAAEPAEPEPAVAVAAAPPKVRTPPPPRPTPRVEPSAIAPSDPQEQPPFFLVGFLTSGGKVRVSVRVGDEVRVVSEGDQVAGWRCLSIDRDEGAVFASGTGARAVLIPRP